MKAIFSILILLNLWSPKDGDNINVDVFVADFEDSFINSGIWDFSEVDFKDKSVTVEYFSADDSVFTALWPWKREYYAVENDKILFIGREDRSTRITESIPLCEFGNENTTDSVRRSGRIWQTVLTEETGTSAYTNERTGTVILPGRDTISDVLLTKRVTYIKSDSVHVGNSDRKEELFTWRSPEYRYPLASITRVTYPEGEQISEGWVCLPSGQCATEMLNKRGMDSAPGITPSLSIRTLGPLPEIDARVEDDNLVISANTDINSDLLVQICDISGRLYRKQEIKGSSAGTGDISAISLEGIPSGEYLVSFFANGEVRSFKIYVR